MTKGAQRLILFIFSDILSQFDISKFILFNFQPESISWLIRIMKIHL